MSGLAALFHRDGRPICQRALSAMLAAVPYRGPDGTWVWLGDAVGLGFAKMAVTPEEECEHQPLISPRTGCVLIADVRLDNREDLLARLPDRPLPTASDAELILRAYEAWGIDAAVHLLGDFAFVVWDPRHRRLVCARDTSGQRALYYRVDDRTFAAASEIHQLLQDPAVPVAPNEERIRDFLVPANTYRNDKDGAATFYAGIRALPARHTMVIDSAAMRERRYWDLKPPAELRCRSDDEYADCYRELFFEVVRARLRSARPVGAMLSGGLDSASVVCAAQELYRAGRVEDRGFTTFSFVYDMLECDERGFIQDVSAKYGLASRYLVGEEFSSGLPLEPRGFRAAPQAVGDGRDALLSTATQAGVRALLTGEVADSYVGGSRLVFDSLLRQGKLRAFWRHWRSYRALTHEPLCHSIAFGCVAPLLPLGVQRRLMAAYLRRAILRNRTRLLPPWMPEPLRAELSERHLQLCLSIERGRRFASPAREEAYRMLYPPEATGHPAPWPLEVLRPFADRRLHEFMLAIPPEQTFEPHPETDEFYAGSKRLVRLAMRGILPESIRTRTSKTVFRGVFERELARDWPAYEAAFGPAGRSELAAWGYTVPALFWSRLQELRGGDRAADAIYIMQVVALETWLRTLALPRPQLVTVAPAQRSRAAEVLIASA